jgi:hypothetical protein
MPGIKNLNLIFVKKKFKFQTEVAKKINSKFNYNFFFFFETFEIQKKSNLNS